MATHTEIILIRASHANEFELQNYSPLAKKLNLRVITSHHPLTDHTLPTTKLWSPTDLPYFPLRRQLLNRLIGGEQWLLNLKQQLQKYNDSNHYIIHTAETYTPYTHQAVQLKKAGKIGKLICTCWETIPHNNEKFAVLKHWKKEAYQYVDLFHTPTNRAKAALIAEGVSPSKIKVIPYGVDLTRFKPGQKKPNKRPLVLTVARLVSEKGISDIQRVALNLPHVDFLIVGQGNYRFDSPNITTRTVAYSRIHKLYQRADIFLFPPHSTSTWEEQYGMALIEAMATGLPIIATITGAIPEVLNSAGILVPAQNPDSLLLAVKRLLVSPAKRLALSSRARTHARIHYDRRLSASRLTKLYK